MSANDTTKQQVFGLSARLARVLEESKVDSKDALQLKALLKKLAVATTPIHEPKQPSVQRDMPAGAFGRRPRQVKVFGHLFKEDTIARMVCYMFCWLEERGKNIDHKQIGEAIKKAYPENSYNEIRAAIDEKKWANLQFGFQLRGEYVPKALQKKAAKPKGVKDKPVKTAKKDDIIAEEIGL